MNDREELTYAADEMEKRLQGRITSLGGDDLYSEEGSRVQILRNILYEIGRLRAGEPLAWQAHAACFCRHGDLLSQWRGYAGGTSGFAIGFRPEMLAEPNPHPSNESLQLIPIVYGSHNAQESFDGLETQVATHGTGHPGTAAWHEFPRVMKTLASVKNPGFREEQEYRLLRITGGGFEEFRASPYGIAPYLRIGYRPAAIARIIVGPGAEQRATETAVRRLLTSYLREHGSNVMIDHSQVKYR